MHTNNLREKITKIAYFIGRDRMIKKQLWTFDQLEDELDIPKQKIIYILDCFVNAKLFHYTIIPTCPEIEEYDLFPTKKMIESKTGMIAIRHSSISKENIKTIVELIESSYKLDQFIKKYCYSKKTPELVGGMLDWLGTSIPMKDGQHEMMNIFLKNPKIISGKRTVHEGSPIHRRELRGKAQYNNSTSFRDGLKRLRAKIRSSGLPMKIFNCSKNHYMLQIEQPD